MDCWLENATSMQAVPAVVTPKLFFTHIEKSGSG